MNTVELAFKCFSVQFLVVEILGKLNFNTQYCFRNKLFNGIFRNDFYVQVDYKDYMPYI